MLAVGPEANHLSPQSLPGGFPGGSEGKESACSAGDLGSIAGLGRSPGEGILTPVFRPGKFHGQRSPAGLRKSDTTE